MPRNLKHLFKFITMTTASTAFVLGCGQPTSSPDDAPKTAKETPDKTDKGAKKPSEKAPERSAKGAAPNAAKGALLAQYKKDEAGDLIVFEITDKAITIEGKEVIPLTEDMHVDVSHKRGGANSLYLKTYIEALDAALKRLKPKDNKDDSRVVYIGGSGPQPIKAALSVHPAVSLRVLNEVMYSSGQRDIRFFSAFIESPSGTETVLKLTAPDISVGPEDMEEDEKDKPVDITVLATSKGMTITVGDKTLPPVSGCDQKDTTVCHLEGKDLQTALDALKGTTGAKRDKALQAVLDVFDWQTLYNTLAAVKKDHSEVETIHVGANMPRQMPAALLAEVGATVRYKRQGADKDGVFKDASAFEAARPVQGLEDPCNVADKRASHCLFPFIVVDLVQ